MQANLIVRTFKTTVFFELKVSNGIRLPQDSWFIALYSIYTINPGALQVSLLTFKANNTAAMNILTIKSALIYLRNRWFLTYGSEIAEWIRLNNRFGRRFTFFLTIEFSACFLWEQKKQWMLEHHSYWGGSIPWFETGLLKTIAHEYKCKLI